MSSALIHKITYLTAGMALMAGALTLSRPGIAAESVTVVINGNLVKKPCEFTSAPDAIALDSIAPVAFADKEIKNKKAFTVTFKCEAGTPNVRLKVGGTPDNSDNTAFQNTGNAKDVVGLRLQDKDRKTLGPDDVLTLQNGASDYTFTAGYVRTSDSPIVGGSFASSVNIEIQHD